MYLRKMKKMMFKHAIQHVKNLKGKRPTGKQAWRVVDRIPDAHPRICGRRGVLGPGSRTPTLHGPPDGYKPQKCHNNSWTWKLRGPQTLVDRTPDAGERAPRRFVADEAS